MSALRPRFPQGVAPLLWVAGVLPLMLAGGMAYEAVVLIPERVLEEQSRLAEQVLLRQAALVELAGDSPGRVRTLLGLEAGQPYLRLLALQDAAGRVLTAVGAGADEGPRAAAGGAMAEAPRRLVVSPEPERGLLSAVLALGSGRPVAALADDGAPGPLRLHLELDLAAAERAALAQGRLPGGVMAWLAAGAAGVLGVLGVLGAQALWRAPVRQRGQAAAPARVPPPTPSEERNELNDLAGQVDRLGALGAAQEAARQAAEARWAAAQSVAGEGYWDWDLTTDRVYYSARWKALLGYAPEALGESLEEWTSRLHPDDLPACQGAFERHRDGTAAGFEAEFRLCDHDGAWRWFQCRGRIVDRDAEQRPLRMVGALADVTERRQAERSLAYLVGLGSLLAETSRALLAAQPEAMDQVLERVLGALARRLDLARACIQLLGSDGQALTTIHEWCAAEVAPRRLGAEPVPVAALPRWMETLRHEEEVRIDDLSALPGSWARDRQVLAELGIRAAVAVPLRLGAGLAGCLVAEMASGPRAWRDGEVRALRLLGDLIGAALERRRLAQMLMESRHRMERAVLFDPLTGLPNRVLLAERMRTAMAAARAGGTELAVCSLDLDGFKILNDSLGREVGDLLLYAVATRLREQVRESDSVARLGGDEFVLLLGGFENPLACARVLEPLLVVLGEPYQVGERQLRVTASLGVTLYPRDPADADTLLRHADHAMYRAKQRGRNCYRFFNPSRDRQARARHSRLERIAVAIERDELVLYFQPKVDMRRGRVIGAEGLVRWRHPQEGLLPPGAFIPLLVGTAVEQRLDAWVLETGLDQLVAWRELGLDLSLSLNISARSVQHPNFVQDLGERLARRTGFVPETLSLEILESEALVDLEAVACVMQHCAGLGVGFALDDFGTGYSSLTYFRRLPAQVLKIDQTFVRDMLRSPDDRNIVEGVVGLARAFRREVIAEGVESAAHGLVLLRMGCDQAQGYGVAEPMAAGLLPDWVAGYRPPPLWGMDPEFPLSDPLLDLLGAEALYRDWVAGLIRAPSSGARAGAAEEHGGFASWFADEGRRRYGGLDEFARLEPLHASVLRLGQDLADARERGEPTGGRIADLIAARDHAITALRSLQEAVLRGEEARA